MRHRAGIRRTTSTAVTLAALVILLTPSTGVAVECGPPPPAIRDVTANTFYSDARHSIVDPVRYERRRQSIAPLNAFESELARYASRSQKGSAAWGACAGRWLAAWAQGGALLGRMSEMQAEFERKWALASLAMAYIRAKPHIAASDRVAIEPWLLRVAAAVDGYYRSKLAKLRNNHYNWLGFALMAAADSTGDAALFRRAETIFDETLAEIAPDGHLPREAARGRRALHYHNFALVPLVMMAEIAARRGDDWYAKADGALHRLVRFTLDSHRDSATVARLAETTQEPLADKDFGWMALYATRFPARVAGESDLAKGRYWMNWVGGDMNALAKAWVK